MAYNKKVWVAICTYSSRAPERRAGNWVVLTVWGDSCVAPFPLSMAGIHHNRDTTLLTAPIKSYSHHPWFEW
jgi:hypothetical protein